MIYLALDTCVFAELLKNIEFNDILNQILYWHKSGMIDILVPDIVLEEWENNKDDFEKFRRNIIKQKLNNTKEILEIVKGDNSELIKVLSEFDINNNVIEDLNKIDSMLNTGINISISDAVKLKATDYAVNKKAPFKGKNSMADALIVFSVIEYLENKSNRTDAIFVSHNTSDFSQSKSLKFQLHQDLKTEFEKVQLQFYSHIRVASQKLIEKYNLPTSDLIPKISYFFSEDDYDEFVNRRINSIKCTEQEFKKRQSENSGFIDLDNSSLSKQIVSFKQGFANTEFYAKKKLIQESGRIFRDFSCLDSIKVVIPAQFEKKEFSLQISKNAFEKFFNINFVKLREDIKYWREFMNEFAKNFKTIKDEFSEKYINENPIL